jgi:predicted metal-dependent HD superfamily phosphohydrolase
MDINYVRTPESIWDDTFGGMGLASPDMTGLMNHYRRTNTRRQYHNFNHLMQIFEDLQDNQDAHIIGNPVLVLTTFYHDALMRPGGKNNEGLSAHYGAFQMRGAGVPEYIIREVKSIIIDSAKLELEPYSYNEALFRNADLAILATDEDAYWDYVTAIRGEYGRFTDSAFIAGRSQFIHYVLGLPRIYWPTVNMDSRETRARNNLETELKTLIKGA